MQVRSANHQCMTQDVAQKKSNRTVRGRAPGQGKGHMNRKLITRGQHYKDLRTAQSRVLFGNEHGAILGERKVWRGWSRRILGSKANEGRIGSQELDHTESLRSFKEFGSYSICDGKLLEPLIRGLK